MQDDIDLEEEAPRSFWSGTIAFGLVSVPVSLYVANRSSRVGLRMLDADGTPLSRRYFCTRDEKPLENDELVRGYEVEPDQFIEIHDDELEALRPDKTREIDLSRFVPQEDIDPIYFERAYYLVPQEGANKAYRLLAASMQAMGRAGIATFVMRGKEYLIAIVAEGGLLRAETLRFKDELRTPEDVGLGEVSEAPAQAVNLLLRQIETLADDELMRSELTDSSSERLVQLVEQKLAEGEGVIPAPEHAEPESASAEIIDLMQILKKSLQSSDDTDSSPQKPAPDTPSEAKASGKASGKSRPASSSSGKRRQRAAGASSGRSHSRGTRPLTKASLGPDTPKAELYEMAKQQHIPGRSNMSKDELLRALRDNR